MAAGETLHLGYVLDSDEDEPIRQPVKAENAVVVEAVDVAFAELGGFGELGAFFKRSGAESACKTDSVVPGTCSQPRSRGEVVATPLRNRKRQCPSPDLSLTITCNGDEDDAESAAVEQTSAHPLEGYALRDLRRIIDSTLPRYRHLLSGDEDAALTAFSNLSLPGQQLFARLFGRKWPQWISLDGLGERYKELGKTQVETALRELTAPPCPAYPLAKAEDVASGSEPSEPLDLEVPMEPVSVHVAPWVLDSKCETAASLLARQLERLGLRPTSEGDSFGTLLLEAQPMADLRQFARSLGVSGVTSGRKSSKSLLVSKLCEAARRQRMLSHTKDTGRIGTSLSNSTVARLVDQVLKSGRWICVAPSPGRMAISLLTDLFHMETSGVAESSFLVFSTRWPDYAFEPGKTEPLFKDRSSLDAFLLSRRFAARLEQAQEKPSAEQYEVDAKFAEAELRKSLDSVKENAFEAAKFEHSFRRRFTTAWCWADVLHCAVMHAPAMKDEPSRGAKIRQLRLLLGSGICISRRGQWYNELAKEVARAEGVQVALQIAAEGLAEGEGKPIAARIIVDLDAEASSQEVDSCQLKKMESLPSIRQDLRWDLARRCRSLAQASGSAKRGGKKNWQYWLRSTLAAQDKAAGTDDGGRWLPALVSRLLAEEAAAPGPIRCIPCTCVGLPSARQRKGARRYDAFDLSEVGVEELALAYYFREMAFDCGIHCEGALLRDLFGIMLFSEVFDPSIEGVYMSAYQDAPLDLGTEVFYSTRRLAIEKRLTVLAGSSPSELAADVNSSFERLYGTRIRGVQWDRYEGPNARLQANSATPEASNAGDMEEGSRSRRELRVRSETVPEESFSLGAVAGAIGGAALAAALRLLCLEYNSAGLPDLLLWSFPAGQSPRARFVEVKSENDSLSRRQRVWLATLRGSGAEAEVCHVRDVPPEQPSQ